MIFNNFLQVYGILFLSSKQVYLVLDCSDSRDGLNSTQIYSHNLANYGPRQRIGVGSVGIVLEKNAAPSLGFISDPRHLLYIIFPKLADDLGPN